MSNNKMDNLLALTERAMARFENRPMASLGGEAGRRKAALARNAWDVSGNNAYGSRDGREALLKKTKMVPHNCITPKTIESTARLAGWLEAARDDEKCWAAKLMVQACYPEISRGVYSPVNKGPADPWVICGKWLSPRTVTVEQMRSVRWLMKAQIEVDNFTPKALHLLGKLSAQVRWAAINYPVNVSWNGVLNIEFSHREIRWDLVQRAEKGLRVASSYFPKLIRRARVESLPLENPPNSKYTWGYSLGSEISAAGFAGLKHNTVSPKLFKEVMNTLEKESKTTEMYDAVYRLCLVFSDFPSIKKWVTKTQGEYNDIGVHDSAQTISMAKISRKWASLVLMAPAQALPYMSILPEIERLGLSIPKSIEDLRQLVIANGLECQLQNVTSIEKEYVTKNPTKSYEALPAVTIVNGKYMLRKVAYNSIENLTAGKLTNCCQHLEGAGSACAAAAWSQPEAGIYAIYAGVTMIAQSFAWRSKDGSSLVLDSIEAKGKGNAEVIADMFTAMAEKVVGRLSIKRVLVADGCGYGVTQTLSEKAIAAGGKKVETPEAAFYLGYSDARYGCVVVAKSKLKVRAMKTVKTAQPEVPTINALQEGSDVYCEHCDSEVHPACVICPTCGENIAEWV